MLSGLTMEEMDPTVPKKSPKIEPDTKHQSGDSSELFGQDIEDIDCVPKSHFFTSKALQHGLRYK